MSSTEDFLRRLRELLEPAEHSQNVNYTDITNPTTIEIDGDLSGKKTVAVDVYYTGFDVGDGTIELQQKSGGGNRWKVIVGSAQVLSAGVNQINIYNHADFGGKNLRLKYTPGTDTAGTIERFYVMAKPQ